MDPPPGDAWIDTYLRMRPRWELLKDYSQTPIPIVISRVNQFDAARLDVEMSAMLKEQLVKVFSLIKPGIVLEYDVELNTFLEFLIWRFSIWVDKPTPGNALMNLRYRDERTAPMQGKGVRTGLEGPGLSVSQKILYCLSTIGGPYIWYRLQSFSAFRRSGDPNQTSLPRHVWSLIQYIEKCFKVVSFSNLLIFLCTGRYRTIIERILRARLVYGSPHMNRSVSFEYMNRQLVWNEFSEMLLLLLPLLNSSSITKFLIPSSKCKPSGSNDTLVCPICHTDPVVPFLAVPCHHRYCYYCLRTRCAAVSLYRCECCNEPVVALQRAGALLGEVSKSTSNDGIHDDKQNN